MEYYVCSVFFKKLESVVFEYLFLEVINEMKAFKSFFNIVKSWSLSRNVSNRLFGIIRKTKKLMKIPSRDERLKSSFPKLSSLLLS